MAGIHVQRWTEGGRRVLRVLGTFDGGAARVLRHWIGGERERDIVIDLGFLRGFDEVGVAAVARLIEGSGDRRIQVRGLSAHQRRILRYLGAALPDGVAGIES